jgi:hypothetical protein
MFGIYSLTQLVVLDCVRLIVYEHNGNALLEYKGLAVGLIAQRSLLH